MCDTLLTFFPIKPLYEYAQPMLGQLVRVLRQRGVPPSRSAATMSDPGVSRDDILKAIASRLPPADPARRKGQSGRLGVVGGSEEYSGAPYFVGISMMRAGADLAHIFCQQSAATAIKCYSPELIVHPLLDKPDGASIIKTWLSRLHSLVVGPGLGRDPSTMQTVREILAEAKNLELPIVIDADGLSLVTSDPSVIQNYNKAILTPNEVEFKRLCSAVLHEECVAGSEKDAAQKLASALQVVILKKGQHDIITDGHSLLVCDADGSPRRCGGQGDILSGLLGTFAFWMQNADLWCPRSKDAPLDPLVLAAYAACSVTRECAVRAHRNLGRSTLASDMIQHIHGAFGGLFGDK